MIKYKYIENYFNEDPSEEEFCKQHDIIYIERTPKNKKRLESWLKTAKLPKIETKNDIICYWRPFGTWGMYHPEDMSISICPLGIENTPGGLEGVIKHEIKHLEHPEADSMPHKLKEDYIERTK